MAKKKSGLRKLFEAFGIGKKGGKNQFLTEKQREEAGTNAPDIEKHFGEKPKETPQKPTTKRKPTKDVSLETAQEIAQREIDAAAERKKRREEMKKRALTGKK